jgi:hypothetical protein
MRYGTYPTRPDPTRAVGVAQETGARACDLPERLGELPLVEYDCTDDECDHSEENEQGDEQRRRGDSDVVATCDAVIRRKV